MTEEKFNKWLQERTFESITKGSDILAIILEHQGAVRKKYISALKSRAIEVGVAPERFDILATVAEQKVHPPAVDFTDTGNARRFAQENKGIAIYVKSVDWLTWNGMVWLEGELEAAGLAMQVTDKMLAEAKDQVKAAGDAVTAATVEDDGEEKKKAQEQLKVAEAYRKHAKNSRNQPKIAAMLKLARTLMQVKSDKLDSNPYLLNTPAGMVDLKTGEILPHNPKAY